jgi:hypothetical protein
MRLIRWRRSAAIAAVALLGAVAAYLLVALLTPRPSETQELAYDVLAAARDDGPGQIAGRLPPGSQAEVTASGGTARYQARGAGADGQVAVVATAVDERSELSVTVTAPATGRPRLAAVAAAAALLLTVVAVATLAGTPAPSRPIPAPAPPPAEPADPAARRTAEQRSTLIHDLAELLPQLPDAVSWQAVHILEAAGVTVVRPDGRRFDPTLHHAVGAERAPDGAAVGVVARTVRPGYTDGDRILVHPRVVVFEDGGAP